jgi:hypothetical protein
LRGATKNLYSSRLSHPSGGFVYCEKCGTTVAKIERMNYQYIKIFFVCKCGNVGKVELYRGKRQWLTYPERPLYNKENNYMCQNCERNLFSVNKDSVYNCTFYVTCGCGVEYDMEYINKWESVK